MKHEDVKHEEGGLAAIPFQEWERGVPEYIKRDTLWLIEGYRLALYLSDLAWDDANLLAADRRMQYVADQLRRATCRISACIAEGYSRNSGKGRATYYEYALGSARESRDWYYKARFAIRAEVVEHRISVCTQIIRLTLKMIATERRSNRRISESS